MLPRNGAMWQCGKCECSAGTCGHVGSSLGSCSAASQGCASAWLTVSRLAACAKAQRGWVGWERRRWQCKGTAPRMAATNCGNQHDSPALLRPLAAATACAPNAAAVHHEQERAPKHLAGRPTWVKGQQPVQQVDGERRGGREILLHVCGRGAWEGGEGRAGAGGLSGSIAWPRGGTAPRLGMAEKNSSGSAGVAAAFRSHAVPPSQPHSSHRGTVGDPLRLGK